MEPKVTDVRPRDWMEGHRKVVTMYNAHKHEPYSKVKIVSSDTTMDDSAYTYVVTATGKTLTLPACTSARESVAWTVLLATAGTVTIQRAGSDTIYTAASASDTSVIINQLGDSITFRCLSTSTWGMV